MRDTFMMAGFAGIVAVFLVAGCMKRTGNSAPPVSPTQQALMGKWTIFKVIAANFQYLPNDTIYPLHASTKTYTTNEIYYDYWLSYSFNSAGQGTFNVTQTQESLDTSTYTSTASYILETKSSGVDTVHIVSLTDSVLVTRSDAYSDPGMTGQLLFSIFNYARKQ